MRGPLMLIGGMALFGSALLGANSLFANLLHFGQPKMQVVQGSFTSTTNARDTYANPAPVAVLDGHGQQLSR